MGKEAMGHRWAVAAGEELLGETEERVRINPEVVNVKHALRVGEVVFSQSVIDAIL